MSDKVQIKNRDVFHFRYNNETLDTAKSDLNWCFQGQLIATERDGTIILKDTYWSFTGYDGRTFTIEEAQRKGILIFQYNLDDVEPVREDDRHYYKPEDIFSLSTHQHSCYTNCTRWFIRKGAQRNQEVILSLLNSNRAILEKKIINLIGRIERNAVDEERVRHGDLSGWYPVEIG